MPTLADRRFTNRLIHSYASLGKIKGVLVWKSHHSVSAPGSTHHKDLIMCPNITCHVQFLLLTVKDIVLDR